jgi:hypothetical protein
MDEKKESKWIVIEKGKTFTQTKLKYSLNELYGNKKTGNPFTVADINKYVDRGHLPTYLGANELKIVDDREVGIKLIEVGEAVSLDHINRRNVSKDDV